MTNSKHLFRLNEFNSFYYNIVILYYLPFICILYVFPTYFSDVFIERVLPLYFSKMKNSRVGRERKELIYDFFFI